MALDRLSTLIFGDLRWLLLVPPNLPCLEQEDRGQKRQQRCVGTIPRSSPPMKVPTIDPAAIVSRNALFRLRIE
jgi:hypothetical protein